MPWTAVSDVRCSMESSTLHGTRSRRDRPWISVCDRVGKFYSDMEKTKQVQERTGGIEVWLIRVLEILTLSMLLIDFFCSSKAYDNQFIVIILFPVFFACLLTRRGVFSKLTDHKMIGLPGRYAYSIYVMQEAVFAVLKRTLWKNTVFLHDYPVPALTVSILVTIMAGIGTYHLVERPADRRY